MSFCEEYQKFLKLSESTLLLLGKLPYYDKIIILTHNSLPYSTHTSWWYQEKDLFLLFTEAIVFVTWWITNSARVLEIWGNIEIAWHI